MKKNVKNVEVGREWVEEGVDGEVDGGMNGVFF